MRCAEAHVVQAMQIDVVILDISEYSLTFRSILKSVWITLKFGHTAMIFQNSECNVITWTIQPVLQKLVTAASAMDDDEF